MCIPLLFHTSIHSSLHMHVITRSCVYSPFLNQCVFPSKNVLARTLWLEGRFLGVNYVHAHACTCTCTLIDGHVHTNVKDPYPVSQFFNNDSETVHTGGYLTYMYVVIFGHACDCGSVPAHMHACPLHDDIHT